MTDSLLEMSIKNARERLLKKYYSVLVKKASKVIETMANGCSSEDAWETMKTNVPDLVVSARDQR